ncbi:MAG TPA: hypothetical protein VIK55_09165 [Paludibacter sp.]|nr:hypothetical protein [Prolixibacteraceae bacterium]
MKSIFFIILSVYFLISNTQAQTKPKEKAPAANEMDEMMKNAQKELDNMSPEDKKAMEDLGVKIPSLKETPNITNQQLQNANNETVSAVPKKDPARIATALSVTLNDAGMVAYIDKVHTLVSNKMKPDYKVRAEEIDQLLSQNNTSSAAQGQTAIAFLMEGKPMLALFLLGKACKKLPDADNLNNYAAVLTNLGAEQLAIPILNNLNTHYPQNSTILNNIGQAWFGLGDIEKANEFIDKAICIYAYHPQANFTKCLIEESKGNIMGAIQAAKFSIKRGYSLQKANKLEKLGYKLKSDDLDWNPPMPKDELGLAKFKWPAYPKNVEESKLLEPAWDKFKEECNNKINELQSQQATLEKQMIDQQQIRAAQLLQTSQTGFQAKPFPEMADKAIVKLGPTVKGIEAVNNYVFANEFQPVLKANEKIEELKMIEDAELTVFRKKYEDKFGDGKSNPFAAACKDENEIKNNFLNEANTLMGQRERVYLNYTSSQIDNLLYYRKYTQWPDEYAWTTVVAQISWLTQISRQVVMFRSESNYCQYAVKEDKPKLDSLQNFDDVACKYISTTDLGCYKITSQCSRLIGEFNCGGIEIKMKQNDETDRFSGSVYVGASKSVSVGKGPISAEAELTAAVGVELSESGKTDLVGKVGANINLAGQTVAGMEGRAGVNSGPSISGHVLGGGD